MQKDTNLVADLIKRYGGEVLKNGSTFEPIFIDEVLRDNAKNSWLARIITLVEPNELTDYYTIENRDYYIKDYIHNYCFNQSDHYEINLQSVFLANTTLQTPFLIYPKGLSYKECKLTHLDTVSVENIEQYKLTTIKPFEKLDDINISDYPTHLLKAPYVDNVEVGQVLQNDNDYYIIKILVNENNYNMFNLIYLKLLGDTRNEL